MYANQYSGNQNLDARLFRSSLDSLSYLILVKPLVGPRDWGGRKMWFSIR